MEKAKERNSKFFIAIAIAMMSLMVSFLVILAVFCRPVADEYAFIAGTRDSGLVSRTVKEYTTHGGRIIQHVGISLSYRIFGSDKAQIVMPIIFLAVLGALLSWIVYELFNFGDKKKSWLAIIIGYLLAAVILFTTVCLFDIYLWLDSAFVHLLGMIMIVYNAALFIYLFKHFDEIKKKKWLLVLMLAVSFIGQTASEASMVLCVGWSIVILGATLFCKKLHKFRKPAIIMFTVLLAGGIVLMASPGLWRRAASGGEWKPALTELLFDFPGKAYGALFEEAFTPWRICLLLLTAIIIGTLIKNKINKKSMIWAIASGVSTILSLTYIPIVIYYFGTKWSGIESRVLGIPAMGLSIGIIIIAACLYATVLQRGWLNSKIARATVVIVSLILFNVWLDNIISFEKGYVAAMSTRAAALDAREAEIYKYKQNPEGKLLVYDAPVMIKKSDATDFTINGFGAVQWFYRSFVAYYQLSNEAVEVSGETMIYNNPPDWYINGQRSYCTIENPVIWEKYYCSN